MFVSHLDVFREISIYVFSPLFDCVVCFSGIELYELLVYFGNYLCQVFHLLLFSPILRVVFSINFVYSFLCSAKAFKFNQVPLVYFVFISITLEGVS